MSTQVQVFQNEVLGLEENIPELTEEDEDSYERDEEEDDERDQRHDQRAEIGVEESLPSRTLGRRDTSTSQKQTERYAISSAHVYLRRPNTFRRG